MPDRADFIEVTEAALDRRSCEAIVARLRDSAGLQPGEVGGGVHPELKHSRDLRISGDAAWREVDQLLQQAVFTGLLAYLRKYPQVLISPLMLQQADATGGVRRLQAGDFPAMGQAQLAELARTWLRPRAINLQWYDAGGGGSRCWRCELFPRDPGAETCTATCCGRSTSMTTSPKAKPNSCSEAQGAPRTGSLLIAPTAFTHTHRGNRPQHGDKFIATSWILFQPAEQLYASS